jgi:hypothetical protein
VLVDPRDRDAPGTSPVWNDGLSHLRVITTTRLASTLKARCRLRPACLNTGAGEMAGRGTPRWDEGLTVPSTTAATPATAAAEVAPHEV